ncbi:AraC family transcriptional regulator [Paenibacillus cisolokensis]|uniref:AraC family transcriptional regulator n=1 Tax=Paenibacillus cisolokensis TaxID=1658519 RepID=UPI003D28CBEA
MPTQHSRLWKEFMGGARFHVSVAAYTKVPSTWRDTDFVPDFNRFYMIREGEGLIRIEDREIRPEPGQLVLMPAGVRQSYSTISEDTFGKYWCHFTATIGEMSLFDLLEVPPTIRIDRGDEWQAWTNRFETLIREMHNPTLAAGFRVTATIMEMVAAYIETAGRDVRVSRSTAVVDKINTVVRYMESRLDQQLTVEEMAKVAHYHPNYFIHVFKQFTGLSPIQYVNSLRIERAKRWLAATDMTVSEIAEQLGMSLYYFSRLFKEQTGFSPTAYRQLDNR